MFVAAGVLQAQNLVYVDASATPPGTGTQANPFTSIQVAVESVGGFSQDVILVRPGTYVESIDTLDKNLTIRSTDGPLVTTIEASDPSFALTSQPQFFGNQVGLEGFTVTGADQGAALRAPVNMQLIVKRCIVRDNMVGGLNSYDLFFEESTLVDKRRRPERRTGEHLTAHEHHRLAQRHGHHLATT